MVVSGLDRPSAIAKLPDGRLLIAEHGGRIRVADRGVLLAAPAAELAGADVAGEGRMSLALPPDFATSHQVYVSYVARDTGGSQAGRVVRFREVDGTLGEPAVILSGIPSNGGSAPRIRIGPDGALYVATTALDLAEADNLASYAGKILRFAAAGGTPSGNPSRASPVFSSGHRGRWLDFDWEPETGALWSVEPGASGVSTGRAGIARLAGRAVLLEGINAASAAFHAGATLADWRNNLFLASPDGECLYRVAGLASTPPAPVVERLLAGSYGRIVAVLSAADGLYFAAVNGGVQTPPAGPPTPCSGSATSPRTQVRPRLVDPDRGWRVAGKTRGPSSGRGSQRLAGRTQSVAPLSAGSRPSRTVRNSNSRRSV